MAAVKKLGLGTVQWGLNYGVSNRAGITAADEVSSILRLARTSGITVLDTASLYGGAEAALGMNSIDSFRVVTKTPKFSAIEITEHDALMLRKVLLESLNHLNQSSVAGLLLHSAQDLLLPGGSLILAELQRLKCEGYVEKIGVSIYDKSEVDAVLECFIPDIVQLPLNVFDQRLIKSGHLRRLKDSAIEIHVRSVFLQGLLLMELEDIPSYFNPIKPLIKRWHSSCERQGMTKLQAALAFLNGVPEIDTILVGVESQIQLTEIITSQLASNGFDAGDLDCDDIRFINPVYWEIRQ